MSTVAALAPTTPPPGPLGPPPNSEALYEVVNGQWVEKKVSVYSVLIAGLLYRRWAEYAESRGLGTAIHEGVFILDVPADLRRRPDAAFVSAQRWPLDRPIPETGDWEIVPDLAVEVTSPHDLFKDVLAKVDEYFHYGCREVWVINPERRRIHRYSSPTEVLILAETDELAGEPLLPGWRMPVADLFRRTAAPAPPT